MNIVKIGETMELLEKGHFVISEEERQLIAWYACKTEDRELTEKLAEELSLKDCDKEAVKRKYLSILDREEPLVEQIERLLVSVECIRLKEKETLEQLEQILSLYGLTLPEMVREQRKSKQERKL